VSWDCPLCGSSTANYRAEKILKNLAGRTDVEDAVLQLDMLTREESLMVVVRNLEVTHRVDGNVEATKVLTEDIDNNVKATKALTEDVSNNVNATKALTKVVGHDVKTTKDSMQRLLSRLRTY
jgi:hypothetical protein